MGALCSKTSVNNDVANTDGGGTVGVMFRNIDKEQKGYISMKNLSDLMRNDSSQFCGKGPDHVMQKYGTDGKMTFDQFKTWWSSTYTTYDDPASLQKLVDEAEAENAETYQRMESIPEAEKLDYDSRVTMSRS